MSRKRHCWGVYRERPHSPGRVNDDAAIVQAVAEALADHGFTVGLLDADAAEAALEDPRAGIFAMCEQDAILTRLQRAVDTGAVVVNTPQAIRNTYRTRTVERFARLGVPSPTSWILSTDNPPAPPAPEVWIKRADFHATQADDVLFAGDENEWFDGLALFARRGMERVVVQTHAPGDLIKFYGVAGTEGSEPWFDWFYHKDQTLAGHAFDRARLAAVAFQAAHALGVEVFGGDAIVGADGSPVVIDLNAWPSFAVRRAAAAPVIARYLAHAFTREAAPAAQPLTPQAGLAITNG